MNVKTVVKALQPAVGYRIVITNPSANTVRSQSCVNIEHLPPDQRQDDQGNVILWNGLINLDGTPAGSTFWAHDVDHIVWHKPFAHIYAKSGKEITITITLPLEVKK